MVRLFVVFFCYTQLSLFSVASDILCETSGKDGRGVLWIWKEPTQADVKSKSVSQQHMLRELSMDGSTGMLLLKDAKNSNKTAAVFPRIFSKKEDSLIVTMIFADEPLGFPKTRKFFVSYGPNLPTSVGFENIYGEASDVDIVQSCFAVSSSLRRSENQILLRDTVLEGGPSWVCATSEFEELSKKYAGKFKRKKEYEMFDGKKLQGADLIKCSTWLKEYRSSREKHLPEPVFKPKNAH